MNNKALPVFCCFLCISVGFCAGTSLMREMSKPAVQTLQRGLDICLTDRDVLLALTDQLTADLNRSTALLDENTVTLTEVTTLLDECVALAQVLFVQVGVTDEDLTRVCPMWAKFTTQDCPP